MFDADNRCTDCDGKLRHFSGCAFYTGEPVLSLAQRMDIQAIIDGSTRVG